MGTDQGFCSRWHQGAAWLAHGQSQIPERLDDYSSVKRRYYRWIEMGMAFKHAGRISPGINQCHIPQAAADEKHIDTGLIDQLGGNVVTGGQHSDLFTARLSAWISGLVWRLGSTWTDMNSSRQSDTSNRS